MPAVVVYGDLINTLMDVGPTNGQRPLGYADLHAWATLTGSCLTQWEAQTLRILSGEYLTQALESRAIDCPPPWEPAGVDNRQIVTDKVQNAFRSLMRKKA